MKTDKTYKQCMELMKSFSFVFNKRYECFYLKHKTNYDTKYIDGDFITITTACNSIQLKKYLMSHLKSKDLVDYISQSPTDFNNEVHRLVVQARKLRPKKQSMKDLRKNFTIREFAQIHDTNKKYMSPIESTSIMEDALNLLKASSVLES